VLLFDNSSAENPYVMVAKTKKGELRGSAGPLPEWASAMLGIAASARDGERPGEACQTTSRSLRSAPVQLKDVVR